MRNIAIIGFGCAGYHVAKAVRNRDRDAALHVYGDTHLAPYNPMLTTYYVKGAVDYGGMFPFGGLERIAEELKLTLHPGRAVTGLDTAARTLSLEGGGSADYDSLAICTGASAFLPPIPGIDLPGVLKVRAVDDALALRSTLEKGEVRSALVVGASMTGIKVAELLWERKIPCRMVDGAQGIFPLAAFPQTACRIQEELTRQGISLTFNAVLSSIEREGDSLCAVMKDGIRFLADLVVVCIGTRANTGFLQGSGLALRRGIPVDSRMRTSTQGVYAAGDCCEALDLQSGEQRSIGLWANAARQGTVAGENIAGAATEYMGSVAHNISHFLSMEFMGVGDMSACAPEDPAMEYSGGRRYLRAVRGPKGLKCVNALGFGVSGLLKNHFIKSLRHGETDFTVQELCRLKAEGIPEDFITFLLGEPV